MDSVVVALLIITMPLYVPSLMIGAAYALGYSISFVVSLFKGIGR